VRDAFSVQVRERRQQLAREALDLLLFVFGGCRYVCLDAVRVLRAISSHTPLFQTVAAAAAATPPPPPKPEAAAAAADLALRKRRGQRVQQPAEVVRRILEHEEHRVGARARHDALCVLGCGWLVGFVVASAFSGTQKGE
jgi:hypothetical protein